MRGTKAAGRFKSLLIWISDRSEKTERNKVKTAKEGREGRSSA
jgi:hypothetical protein